MPSAAKAAFSLNIDRARYFLDIHKDATPGPGKPKLPLRELPRAAVVFAVGALDAYLTELAAETIVQRLQAGVGTAPMRDVLKRVNQDLPTLAVELAVLNSQTDRLAFLQDAVRDHFQNAVSAHGSKAVARFVDMLGGSPNGVWTKLGANGQATAAGDLDRWTEFRHQIVHQGKRPGIQRERDSRACIDLIDAIAGAVEDEVTAATARLAP